MRKVTSGLLAGGLVLLLSGCYKVDANFDFQEDGTVSGTMTAGLNKEALKQMEGLSDLSDETPDDSSEDPTEFFDEEDLPEGTVVEDWEDDKYVGQKATFKNASIEDAFKGDDPQSEDTPKIELKDGKYYVVIESMGSVLGEEADTEASGQEEMEQFYELYGKPEFNLTFSFPGDITKHEGVGTVKGNSITFDMEDMTKGGKVTIEADAKKPAAEKVADAAKDGPWLWVGGGLVVLLLAALGGILAVRSKKTT